jgi:TM2 domain-containing membrane protein YozV
MAKRKPVKKKAKKPVKKKPVAAKRVTKKPVAMKKPMRVKKKGVSQGIAIVALLLNILIIPGLGSLIAGRTKAGVWQVVLAVVGAILSLILIGIPILIAAWIWGLVTGIQLIQESS